MTKHIDFLFDFASPNAYFAHKVLPQLAHSQGLEVRYLPVLLGGLFKLTHNQSPMQKYGPVAGRLEYEQLEIKRFIQAHELKQFRMNPHFPINTLPLMRALIAAETLELASHYIEVCFSAMWEHKKNLGDPQVLEDTLNEAGFDAAKLQALSQTDAIKQRLADNTQQAAARGAFGVPTFFYGEQMYFGKERITQMLDAIE